MASRRKSKDEAAIEKAKKLVKLDDLVSNKAILLEKTAPGHIGVTAFNWDGNDDEAVGFMDKCTPDFIKPLIRQQFVNERVMSRGTAASKPKDEQDKKMTGTEK